MFLKTNINMYTNMYIVQYKYVQYMNNLKMNTNKYTNIFSTVQKHVHLYVYEHVFEDNKHTSDSVRVHCTILYFGKF